MKVSVIISARNEFPQICMTVQNILDDLSSFLQMGEYEVIIVDNCSNDEVVDGRGKGGTVDFLMSRGMYYSGVLRILRYPTASNVGARNYGAKFAKGEYIFFSDAHMIYGQGTFKRWLETVKESGGLVHPAISWMGAFPPQKGMQYSWKLGEEIKGTWNNLLVGGGNDWFYVPAMGHCSIGVKREQFIDFGGYIENRCYGGGEMYLDTLWWLMGSCSVTEPRINAYHLSAGRGYNYHHDDYIHNVFACGLSLGADWWVERTYLNNLRKGKKEVLDRLMQEAKRISKDKAEMVAKRAVMSFNELLVKKRWDTLNMEKFGSKNSGILIYHESWLNMIEKEGKITEEYKNSKYQKELADFIINNLKEYTYKR